MAKVPMLILTSSLSAATLSRVTSDPWPVIVGEPVTALSHPFMIRRSQAKNRGAYRYSDNTADALGPPNAFVVKPT